MSPSLDWTTADIPSQAGRIIVLTGGTSGVGLETARELVRRGAEIVIAARNPEKGAAVIAALETEIPGARLRFQRVDTGDLGSVRALAARLRATLPRIDVLINNAGLAMVPQRQLTIDGVERQFATNHLGHFLLTAEVWPLLAAAPAARVVAVASIAHWRGRMQFDDLNFDRASYGIGRPAYAQSKLANLLFALELQRRIEAAGSPVRSVAAHPGLAATALVGTGRETGRARTRPGFGTRLMVLAWRIVSQSQADGAWPILYAATAPGVRGGDYFGPAGRREFRGPPAFAEIRPQASDPVAARRLWEASEQLAHTRFDPR